MSVTLTGLVRICKTRYRWKDLSLKKLLFINLYPPSRGLSIFLDKWGRLKEHRMTRQNRNNVRASNELSFETWKPSLEFGETSFCYIHHSKGFRETIYFLRNITMTSRMYRESTDQQHLHVQFLGDKKGQTKVFIWKFGKLTQYFCIKSIFWTIIFELFIYLWRFVFMYIALNCGN